MEIPTERAFEILDSYCQHGTRLLFGGKISGEEAASIAEVTHVWPIAQSITIKLVSDDDERSWDIVVPLRGANFSTDRQARLCSSSRSGCLVVTWCFVLGSLTGQFWCSQKR